MAVYVPTMADHVGPTYLFNNFTSVAMPIQRDTLLMQQVCDAFLNVPMAARNALGTGQPRFVTLPIGDTPPFSQICNAWVVFTTFPTAKLLGGTSGYVPYQEVTIHLPVKDRVGQRPVYFVYPMTLVLDGPPEATGVESEHYATNAIIIGRELFGLPKMRGQITFSPAAYGSGTMEGTSRVLYPDPFGGQLPLKTFVDFRAPLNPSLAPVPAARIHPFVIAVLRWGLPEVALVAAAVGFADEQVFVFRSIFEQLYQGAPRVSAAVLAAAFSANPLASQLLLEALGIGYDYADIAAAPAAYYPDINYLLGLRQLRSMTAYGPAVFANADVRQVVWSLFETSATGINYEDNRSYTVTFGPLDEIAAAQGPALGKGVDVPWIGDVFDTTHQPIAGHVLVYRNQWWGAYGHSHGVLT